MTSFCLIEQIQRNQILSGKMLSRIVVTPEEVTWQCAYWTLAPIAINTMTQPSGKVLGFPSSYGLSLRSSPIVCACDTLYIIAAFIHQTIGLGSPDVAVRVIMQERFGDASSDSESGSFAQFQRNTVVRLVLFILSALLGIIKLYGMQGVPWTKAWAGMYWISFLVLEVFGFLAGKDRLGQAATWISQRFGRPALSVRPYQPRTSNHVDQLQLSGQDSEIENQFWLITGLLMASASFCFFFLPVHYITIVHRLYEKAKNGGAEAEIDFADVDPFFVWGTRPPACCVGLAIWTVWLSFFALTLEHYGPSLSQILEMPKPELAMRLLRGAFVMLNFLGGFHGYMMLYNSEGTVKPLWTKILG